MLFLKRELHIYFLLIFYELSILPNKFFLKSFKTNIFKTITKNEKNSMLSFIFQIVIHVD